MYWQKEENDEEPTSAYFEEMVSTSMQYTDIQSNFMKITLLINCHL